MPVMGGLATLRKINEEKIKIKTVMLTIHEAREYLMETMELGALGYVLKDSDSQSLSKAIRDAYIGESYIQPKLAANLVKEFSVNKSSREKTNNELTKREYEVLSLIAEGLNNKNIAERLFISEKTVKNHVSSIFRKINVNDRTKAAIYAFKKNIRIFLTSQICINLYFTFITKNRHTNWMLINIFLNADMLYINFFI